jgi:hypothetical protein
MKILVNTPKEEVPKAWVGAAVTAGTALWQLYQGSQQKKRAREAIKERQNNRPEITIPLELRRRAAEPIAREFMKAQEDEAGRRVSQSIGALERGGGRTVLGGLSGVLDSDRNERVQRNAAYEQERRRASDALGWAERDVQVRKDERWNTDMDIAAEELNAGNQNTWSAINGLGSAATNLGNTYLGNKSTPSATSNNVLREDYQSAMKPDEGQYGIYAKNGGITKGIFDHTKNPLYLVTPDGTPQMELTGGEYVLNPEQASEVAKESPTMRKLRKKFKTKAHKKQQLQKVS